MGETNEVLPRIRKQRLRPPANWSKGTINYGRRRKERNSH